ncbi:putative transcriptional regulator, Crp/Fnr family [Thalassoporum mexicanum PCC 7367]|uniref:cyclic nucleotide-binding domain-containing protein n=1 Tax=Thalassoporum mexicanum TaxID=3457544 RepID=UPI00029FA13C|nr:cyclic nucleotide-binding domain-containing protein [Pseudanabaena sp. PCC 7367]AFY70665.1 putative transcriptional regulator, Crp/Fnr family [Pseudanabaena sp. PCC 7367]
MARLSQTRQSIVALIRQVPYFEDFSSLELTTLVKQGHRQRLPPRQFICHEGDLGNSFYVILAGEAEVISELRGQFIAILHEGDFFGEISLLTGAQRTATVRSMTAVTLFVLNRERLGDVLQAHPNLAGQLASKLVERQQNLSSLGIVDLARLSTDVAMAEVCDQINQRFGVGCC